MTDSSTPTALGIDIGGTRVRAGIVTADAQIIARVESRLPPDGDPDQLSRTVTQHAQQLIAETQREPDAVGVALPGVWDRDTGLMRCAVNLPKLDGINVLQFFEHALGRPALIETDVNAAAWAEYRSLVPPSARFVYVAIGTGVGGSVILDGQILRHTRGGAGHIGHLIVDTSPAAPRCRCGLRGCLEAIAGGAALDRLLDDESNLGVAATPRGGRRVVAAAPRGGRIEVHQRAAQAITIALLQLAHIYAPDTVALGGGVIDHHPEIVDHVREAFAHHHSNLIPPDLRIVRAALPATDAGVIGAALLALQAPVS